MLKIAKVAALAALMSIGVPANAWWSPVHFSDWANDAFGDVFGDINFNFSMSVRGNGQGYGRGYDYGYYGPNVYAPYYYQPVAAAPVTESIEPKSK
ncbi:exported hypothetical protein [Gammaproteobacteria bacterium]